MAGMTNSITDYVGIVKVGTQEYLTGSTLFGTCLTDANQAAKVVTIEEITSFTPTHGLTIHVLFTNSNTATNPTLQFSSGSGAITYPIYAYGDTKPGSTISTSWRAGAVVSFTYYDGTLDQTATAKRWIMNSGTDTGADGLASVSLANVQNADDLKAIEALTSTGYLKRTGDNTWALQTLNVSGGSASKTLTGIIEDNGNIEGTFTNISITKSQVSDFSHTHGNITNDGKLSNTDASIANNDQLVIIDATDNSGRIAKASLKFDGSTTTTALTPKGTWESFVKSVTITAGNGITVSDSGTAITGTGSRTISIGTGAVTNTMLEHSTITIGTQEKALGESFTLSTLVTDLGLSSAMKYKGGVATLPTATDSTTFNTYNAGDVVTITGTTNKGKEYVYNKAATAANSTWVELGDESSFKVKQTAVSSPTVPSSGTTTATAFIDTISQDVNGVITATKKNVNFPVTSVATLTGAITAANLKSQLGLNNVTNDAQIAKSIGTTKGDIIYFDGAADPKRLGIGSAGQVLTVSSSGIPSWAANQATDEKVKQSPYSTAASSSTKFNLLFKHSTGDTEETNGVYFSTISGKELTWDAYTGTLTATKFSGNGSGLTGITTDHISGTGSGTKFLRQDGWKTLSISYDDASNGKVITGFTFSGGTLPTYTQGTKASASVSNGVLTIVNQGADTFTQGSVATLTSITKTNVAISAS